MVLWAVAAPPRPPLPEPLWTWPPLPPWAIDSAPIGDHQEKAELADDVAKAFPPLPAWLLLPLLTSPPLPPMALERAEA